MRILRATLPSVILLAGVLCVLELSVRQNWVSAFLVASPSQVLAALIEFSSELTTALSQTLAASLQGFLFGFFLAEVLALVLMLSSVLRQALVPFALFFQTVPIIAIAPLLVIWFGFGFPTVRASSAIVCFFPLLSTALAGLGSARPQDLELFRLWRARPLQTLFYLQLPASFRIQMAGLRVGAGLALVGALVGEFVGGGGLGALIDSARTQQRVDLVFACVILSSFLGLMMIGTLSLLDWTLRRWRPL